MKKLFHPIFVAGYTLAICVSAFVGCGGCSTLAPGGAYAGDKLLYDSDQSILGAYQIFDVFLKWEKDNRDELFKLTPDIKKAADNIRANGTKWIDSAIAMREAYKTRPGPDTRTALQSALDLLHQGINEAIKYTVQYKKG
jgi:hypothetical protein